MKVKILGIFFFLVFGFFVFKVSSDIFFISQETRRFSGNIFDSIFSLENIDDIDIVFRSVSRLQFPSVRQKENKRIKAVVLPHHTILGEQLAEFWNQIAESANPKTIVIVGPAHENQGTGRIQTTTGIWNTPFGKVFSDNLRIEKLIQSGAITKEPLSFRNEHSIGTHISYIAKLFPDAKIIPIIAPSIAGERDARMLVEIFQNILPEDSLLVASVDFSHYLISKESEKKDQELLQWIKLRQYSKIDGLDASYLDSPFSLETYLLWMDSFLARDQMLDHELIWHENSGNLFGDPNIRGTSYFVFFAKEKSDKEKADHE